MNIKKLLIPFLFFPLILNLGCLNPKDALDLVDTLSDLKPSSDWVNNLGRAEKSMEKKFGLQFERVPLEGDVKSYNIKVPRDVNINGVLTDLESYQVELDRFLSYYTDDLSNIPNRAEYEKKLEAIKDFLDNYDRLDKYFIEPAFSHD